MPVSIRELVIANVLSTLQSITIENGYINEVAPANVRRMIGGIAEIAEFPMLYIVVGQEQILQAVQDKVTVQIPFTIEAWTRADTSNLPTALESLISDVRRAMNTDYTRGGNAIDSYEDGCTEPILSEAENMRAVVGIHYHAMYRYSRLDPLSV
jgi:hypothetical protein